MENRQLEQQAILLQAMQDKTLYDHEVEEFQLMQTHISWVLLTGPYVYKIKKAVDFGFLDYSTLEKRNEQCIEELRLNRRTAPKLYLDVIPIGGSPDKPIIGDREKPIEYAVKMHQFDQGALFSMLLLTGSLTTEHIIDLARCVAEFHTSVEIATSDSPFGTPEKVFSPIGENFLQIRERVTEETTLKRLDSLEEKSRERFNTLKSTIQKRHDEGYVRECHGDLHLNNITLIDDRPVLFDCIEFNPSLRIIDVMSEIAFLVMDLEENGRYDFANLFLNTYLAETGDYGGLALLRFYQCYRAMVRAKVAILRLAQEGLSDDERESARTAFLGYLALAENYTLPSSPRLIITRGLSGCGKTYISQQLLQHYPAIHLRSDIERKRLFGLRPEEKSDSAIAAGIYTTEATERTYTRLQELAESLLTSGFSVIVDATFIQRPLRDHFRKLAARMKLPFTILDIQADVETLRERIRRRHKAAKDASEADLSVLEHQLGQYRPLDPDEIDDRIEINGAQPPDIKTLSEQLNRTSR